MSDNQNDIEVMIEGGGYGKLLRLRHENINTHAYSEIDNEDNVLPVKLKFACRLKDGSRKFSGLQDQATSSLILWAGNDDEENFALIEREDIRIKMATMNALRKHCPDKIFEKSSIPIKLHELYVQKQATNQLTSLSRLQAINKHIQRSREEHIKVYGNPQEIESRSFRQLEAILAPDQFVLTPPAVTADAYVKVDDKMGIPLQVKAANESKDKTFCFGQCPGYHNMLVLCRPLIDGLGTLVIPGSAITCSKIKYRRTSAKYQPYIIEDDKLPAFIKEFEYAVDHGIALQWPSGIIVDISSIRPLHIDDMCRSTHVNYRVEHSNQASRATLLPDLEILDPSVQNTTVDKIIDGLRIQDKAGEKTAGPAYRVTLKKNAGKVDGKLTKQPYHRDDFDVLWAFVAGDRYFFIIPMSKLIKKRIVATENDKGKTAMTIYLTCSTTEKGDQWTQEFCFDTQSSTIQQEVKQHLDGIKESLKTAT